jgi:hypothetical protein
MKGIEHGSFLRLARNRTGKRREVRMITAVQSFRAREV